MKGTKVLREAAIIFNQEAAVECSELMGVERRLDGGRLWRFRRRVREDGHLEGSGLLDVC